MIGRTGWVVALVAVAGCGGSDESKPAGSDRDQIEATITAYFAAMGEGDGDEACGHLTSSARKNLATALGKQSCEDAIELMGEAADRDPEGRKALSEVRLLRATIDGVKAEATIKAGERQAPTPVPLEKTEDGWKVAGTSSGVQFSSQAQAECVAGGMQEFDEGNADPFWKVEGRADFRDYIAETCRIADRRGLLDDNVKPRGVHEGRRAGGAPHGEERPDARSALSVRTQARTASARLDDCGTTNPRSRMMEPDGRHRPISSDDAYGDHGGARERHHAGGSVAERSRRVRGAVRSLRGADPSLRDAPTRRRGGGRRHGRDLRRRVPAAARL